MKTKIILTAAGLALGAALDAATLNVSTAVQTQPDPASPVMMVLKAGSEQPAPTDKAGAPPAGWSAVEVPGPFEGYVRNRDLTKQLDVLPGASIYLAPKDGAGVLAVFEKGDKAAITGLHGSWTQVRLEKTLVGYIRTGPEVPAPAPLAAPGAALPPASPEQAAPVPSAPAAAAPAAATPAQTSGVALSRLFEGTLASTRTLLAPRRPYDWQLLDAAGKRIAYVDLAKLLLTDQIENYAGHAVVVLGSIRPAKDTNDLVIEVEGFRLK
ncbi:MAG TPA: hypothetical protein VN775_13040 [Opitutaceae bacterium]|nr:hypothetical protein [Opitutaceae bacterium]